MISRVITRFYNRLLYPLHLFVVSVDEVLTLNCDAIKKELRHRSLKVSGSKKEIQERRSDAVIKEKKNAEENRAAAEGGNDSDSDCEDEDEKDEKDDDAIEHGDWHRNPPTAQYSEASGLSALNKYEAVSKGKPGYDSSDYRYWGNINLYAYLFIISKGLDLGQNAARH